MSNKTNLPALPTSTVPMVFNNTISKEDLADLIIAMEEEKLFKTRDGNKETYARLQKEIVEDQKRLSDVIISAMPKDQVAATKQFIAALKVMDPKGCDLYIYEISMNRTRISGYLTNMLPSMFGLAPRGHCAIKVPIACDATPEIKNLMKKIEKANETCSELREQFDAAMGKIQDGAFYQRKVRAKVTAALLTNVSPAEVLKMYSSGVMFKEEVKNPRNERNNEIDDNDDND